MNNGKIDQSLAEVRQWWEQLQITCESMSPQEKTEYTPESASFDAEIRIKASDSGFPNRNVLSGK